MCAAPRTGNVAAADPALALEISRGGRVVRINVPVRRVMLFLAGTLTLAGALIVLAFDGESSPAGAIGHEARRVYEHRIAELRMEVDQLSRRPAVAPRNIAEEIRDLRERQSRVTSRAETVLRLVSGLRETPVAMRMLRTAEIASPTKRLAEIAAEAPAPQGKSGMPHPDGFELRLRDATGQTASVAPEAGFVGSAAVARIADELARIETTQARDLTVLAQPVKVEAARLRRAFDIAGLAVASVPHRQPPSAVGGPYVAADAADRGLAEAEQALGALNTLRGALHAAPLRKPLAGPLQLTSNFGYRLDPFFGRPALHSGVDLRDEPGKPVLATGAGVVTAAGPNAGYGNLVEVDHGRGLTTRYGHLSQIAVASGARVRAGDVIGRLGSTGRSTGPHLHYEVRVNGAAVDPERFLRAAQTLENGANQTADAR